MDFRADVEFKIQQRDFEGRIRKNPNLPNARGAGIKCNGDIAERSRRFRKSDSQLVRVRIELLEKVGQVLRRGELETQETVLGVARIIDIPNFRAERKRNRKG